MPESQINQPSSHSASEQPDQEPEEMPITPSNSPEMNPPSIIQNNPPENNELQPHEIPVPESAEDELLCDLLLCQDDDNCLNLLLEGENLVLRAEMEFSQHQLASVCQNN